ncbi:MAG TPA: protein phosphatase 2C domain-containing protein [Nocardioidaceae bacterium]|nr:protein phosphatase 2C domain-containing protein [Nocardioidaceae bacterium]
MTTPHPVGRGVSGPVAGPTVSFGFNLGKIPDHGEDSDPILRDGPDLGLLAVFDGMGGAGGTVYETPDGPRSGAYLASRIARDVVEQRMLQLLVPDWNLKGEAAAEDLRRSVQQALQDRLHELKAPKSGLRSRLLRALPTTMVVLALQRASSGGSTWLCHVFWAGDSRGYVFAPDGARQLTVDDLRDPSDAMTNLRRDSVVSNAMSADTEFQVNYRRVELESPFLLVAATDGCFGYVPSPMHFEHLVLGPLVKARSADGWSSAVQSDIATVTGDDAAMSVMAVGAHFPELRRLYADRVRELEEQYTGPIDEMQQAVSRAEDELEALRQRQAHDSQRLWARYQPTYEQFLHGRSKPEAPDTVEDGALDDDPLADGTSGESPAAAADGAQPTAPEGGPATPEEVSP